MSDKFDLVRGWTVATDYAVLVRYDLEFWPTRRRPAMLYCLSDGS